MMVAKMVDSMVLKMVVNLDFLLVDLMVDNSEMNLVDYLVMNSVDWMVYLMVDNLEFQKVLQ
jgi:hypothetical protein